MTLIDQVRHLTTRLLAKRTRRSLRFDAVRLRARLKSSSGGLTPRCRRLHLGCGRRLVTGFVNVDVTGSDYDIDISSGRLPWLDGSFDTIVSQQVIEHLELESELLPLLSELTRVLVPGGDAWLACPDMERICRSYLADGGRALLADRQKRWPGFTLNGLPTQQMMNVLFHQAGEHVNLFDFPLLRHLLLESGFAKVERVSETDLLSSFPEMPRRDDDEFSLYVRASR